jgi:serpin B
VRKPPDGETIIVQDVLQEAMVEMKETGVQAAAATAVIVTCPNCVAGMYNDVPMTVDRPYLFAIVDNPTGAILFLGHVQDPTSSGNP